MAISPEGIEAAITLFRRARAERKLVPGLSGPFAPETIDDAYAIQDAFIRTSGRGVGGWKVGCTSDAAQELLGMGEPFYGPVFSDVIMRSPAEPSAKSFHAIAVECEFAFRLQADLYAQTAPHSRGAVLEAVGSVIPAIEVISTRLDSFTAHGGKQVIADCGANGALILGQEHLASAHPNLDQYSVALEVEGLPKGTGTGAEVLGHPVNALIWFVNQRAARGESLRAGEVISTGTCTGLTKVEPDETVIADFGSLGKVQVWFR